MAVYGNGFVELGQGDVGMRLTIAKDHGFVSILMKTLKEPNEIGKPWATTPDDDDVTTYPFKLMLTNVESIDALIWMLNQSRAYLETEKEKEK